VLRIPFPLPAGAPGEDPAGAVQAVADIFSRVGSDARFGGLGHDQLISTAKREMTKHVYSYFDVSSDEQILIKDTVEILQRSATPSRGSKVPTLAPPTENERRRYAGTLIEALRAWTGGAGGDLRAECILSEKSGVAVLTIGKSRSSASYSEVNASANLDQVLSRLRTLAPERYGSLVYLRNLAILEKDRIHVVKPLTRRFWLRSAALNDADAAASRLLDRRSVKT
jgi:hypothetical protein